MTLNLKKRVREINFKYSSLSGNISSKKINQIIQFESSLERDFIYLLEFDDSVKSYLEQPMIIKYNDLKNAERKYTPDFFISYHDKYRKDELIEIKYKKTLAEDKKLQFKLESARHFCIKNNMLFRIITEDYVRIENKIKLENFKFLSRHKSFFENINRQETGFPYFMGDIFQLKSKIKELRKCTVNELVNSCCKDRDKKAELIFLTWWLVSNYSIEIDFSQKLSLDSLIWKP